MMGGLLEIFNHKISQVSREPQLFPRSVSIRAALFWNSSKETQQMLDFQAMNRLVEVPRTLGCLSQKFAQNMFNFKRFDRQAGFSLYMKVAPWML